ncbi:MAG: alpha/beta hydrolase [Roseovarius sp.]|nr:alpha/beta hydrolase [Roseovarius sp.]MCY4291500.1 alpha/beta hydrolase [Roseovarius sp.]MCY4315224.1 alpha/beta hydrolase [Roseovarius sp.]
MPEIIFSGPDGRLEGRYHPQSEADSPLAVILHPHPEFGGTMNNKVVYNLHYAFHSIGFTVLRFNFRGVGRSQGEFDHGNGELSDAAAALDYLQAQNSNSKHCWVAGFSFGAWIGMQLLMRRPEMTGFVSVCPPANMHDFSFLAPCPSSGLIVSGTRDRIALQQDTLELVCTLQNQRGITIEHHEIEEADHFFKNENHMQNLIGTVKGYVKRRLTENSR